MNLETFRERLFRMDVGYNTRVRERWPFVTESHHEPYKTDDKIDPFIVRQIHTPNLTGIARDFGRQ